MGVATLTSALLLTAMQANAPDMVAQMPTPIAAPASTTNESPAADPQSPPAAAPAPLPAIATESLAPAPATTQTETEQAEATPTGEHGEIVVTGRLRVTPSDPLVELNATSFEITQAIDVALIRPVAKAYQKALPAPVRDGIRNVINNLREPVVFVNFLLQLKPGKAFETLGRFALNSTVGVAGLVDVAKRKPFKLPRRPNGLANTLGFYGVKPGAFLFLPLIGPTTVRDVIGDGLDRLILPLAVGKPFNRPEYAIPIYVFSSLDQRAEFDEKLQALHNDTADPYVATREDYLANRRAAIQALHDMGKKKKAKPADAEAAAPAAATPAAPPAAPVTQP